MSRSRMVNGKLRGLLLNRLPRWSSASFTRRGFLFVVSELVEALVDLLPLVKKQTDGFLPEFLCLVDYGHNS